MFLKRWTSEEKKILHSEATWEELLVRLPHRSLSAIKLQCFRLRFNCIRDEKFWTKEEIDILSSHAPDYSKAAQFLPRFSRNAIVQKGRKLGFSKLKKWSSLEDDILRAHGSDMGNVELAALLSERTRYAVGVRCLGLGIRKSKATILRLNKEQAALVDRDRTCKVDQTLKLTDLEDSEIQVLLGSVLGDGCVTKANSVANLRNYCFVESHCQSQVPYLEWKAVMLKRFHPSIGSLFLPSGHIYGKPINVEPQRKMTTASHPIFSLIRKTVYAKNLKGRWHKTYIPESGFLEHLNLFGLLIWYLDDGTSGRNRNTEGPLTPSISSSLFHKADLERLVIHLNTKFGLSLSVKGDTIQLGAASRDKLLPIWSKLVQQYGLPRCMYYKLNHSFMVDANGCYECVPWGVHELQIIHDGFQGAKSDEEVASKLLQRRFSTVRRKRREMGLLHLLRWSDPEIQILFENPHKPIKELTKLLPHRSERSIYHKRGRLGIAKARKSYLSSPNPFSSNIKAALRNCSDDIKL